MRQESCSKLAVNWKNINDVTNIWHDVIISFFYFVLFLLLSWSKFHVNIITGSGVLTIYFYKGLTKSPEIRNTLVWVLSFIWRLGQVRNTKFGTHVFNKMLRNAAKCQGYSSYSFWVIKGKSTGREVGG